ncbi:hypothetical protein K490DRAFT_64302 [Saccharata proteae CBS 121410]|uniref:Peptidase S54 rhomboid domain-containing protein n=1 Tax=Saccharata proteae CBS 121410 TaxID=1314787 RepID=A0A6A5YB53_9PEZI|nr:hypothetical protein K490DRAFT_64302 [Saccharata proteae CBS 121410]
MSNAWPVALTCSRQLGLRTSCLSKPVPASLFAVRALSSLSARSTRQSNVPSSILHSTQQRAFSLSTWLQMKLPKGKPASSKPASPKSALSKAASPEPKPSPPAPKPRTQPQGELQEKARTGFPPLPNGDLSEPEIKAVFGKDVSPSSGNTVLRILHLRRLTGSLADEGLHFDDAPPGINSSNLNAALDYLRAKYPIDEEARAAAWTKAEIQRLEQELLARGQKLGLYKRTPGEEEQTHENLYGYSQIEALRRENEAAWEQEQKIKSEKEAAEAAKAAKAGKAGGLAKTNSTGVANTGGFRPIQSWAELKANRKKSEWYQYYEDQAMLTKSEELPNLSYAQRVLPSFLLLLATLGLLYIFTQAYDPAPRSARLFPNTPPAMATVSTLVALNLFVFLLWKYPPAWKFLNTYFVQSMAYPTAFSLLGSTFSHVIFWSHLVPNMATVYLVGPRVHDQLGRADFLALYIGTAAIGAFASLAWLARSAIGLRSTSYGASGGVYGIIAAHLVLRDYDDPALPYWKGPGLPYFNWGLLGLLGGTTVLALAKGPGNINVVAHLAGLVAGTVYAVYVKSQRGKERGVEED